MVLEPPDLRTNCACNRLQLVASGLDPLPTYLIMYAGYVFGNYTWVFVVHERRGSRVLSSTVESFIQNDWIKIANQACEAWL